MSEEHEMSVRLRPSARGDSSVAERFLAKEEAAGANPVPRSYIAGWCSGSTPAFGAGKLGSNPSPAARAEVAELVDAWAISEACFSLCSK